jgi:anti-sigma factor (TIGR02949 family)
MPNVPDIDCLMAVRQLWDYLDGELTEDRMAMVRQHLERCQRCLPHYDFDKLLLDALHATRDTRLTPVQCRARVMALLADSGFVA